MKWYFCINASGAERYSDHIIAAVRSAKKNTDLTPICVCHDPQNTFPKNLEDFLLKNGVSIIRDESVIYRKLIDNKIHPDGFSLDVAAGAYLRFEVPRIETEDKFVLYTDCDVIFCPGFSLESITNPKYFSCSPEFDYDNWSYFNSGVMIINIESMKLTYDSLISVAFERLKSGLHQSYDQGDLNAFYWMAWNHLPPQFNWKPYWGINNSAKIIHFHGPKPKDIENIISGDTRFQILVDLFMRDRSSYEFYVEMYKNYL